MAARRKKGGRVPYDAQGSNVLKEAEEKNTGGPVKSKSIGRHTGGRATARLDKRARGGGIGSDTKPFSSAAKGSDTGRTSKTGPTLGR